MPFLFFLCVTMRLRTFSLIMFLLTYPIFLLCVYQSAFPIFLPQTYIFTIHNKLVDSLCVCVTLLLLYVSVFVVCAMLPICMFLPSYQLIMLCHLFAYCYVCSYCVCPMWLVFVCSFFRSHYVGLLLTIVVTCCAWNWINVFAHFCVACTPALGYCWLIMPLLLCQTTVLNLLSSHVGASEFTIVCPHQSPCVCMSHHSGVCGPGTHSKRLVNPGLYAYTSAPQSVACPNPVVPHATSVTIPP
jgi:hypothetical protein